MEYQLNQVIYDEIDSGFIVLDNNRKVVLWNKWISDRCNYNNREVLNKKITDIFPEMIGTRIVSSIDKCIQHRQASHISNRLIQKPFPLYMKGTAKTPENKLEQIVTVKPVNNSEYNNYCFISISDLSKIATREETLKAQTRKLKHTLQEVENKNKYLKAFLDRSKDVVITFSSTGKLDTYNPSLLRVFSVCDESKIKNKMIYDMIPEFRDFKYRGEYDFNCIKERFFIGKGTKELKAIDCGGKNLTIEYTADEMFINNKKIFFALIRDITTKKNTEMKLQKLSQFDAVTGLFNRNAFLHSLQSTLNKAKDYNKKIAVLFLDIDHFSKINSSIGHDTGDKILKEFARILKCNLSADDIISRVGGDDFTVILEPHCDVTPIVNSVESIIRAINNPLIINDHELSITASIGISVYPQDGHNIEALLKNADIALYKAKKSGRNTFRFFTNSMSRDLSNRLKLESELSKAIKESQFRLYYQPQVDCKTGKVIGVEALIRWQHNKRGIISPIEFIPIAEETGLITEIGQWTMIEGCCTNAMWNKNKIPINKMSINLSPKQFSDEKLIENLSKAITNCKIKPENIVMEITESHIVENSECDIKILNSLKELGVSIAIDDFGTGYSSLQYLKDLPVDIVKIDRSFVMDCEINQDSARLLKGIINLVHSLGKEVIAEGIENLEQYNILKHLECDYAQGYFINKPLPNNELIEWFNSYKTI